jgi:hypothetical protein
MDLPGHGAGVSGVTDALVAGFDSPSLRELAGASAKADYWTLRPLVEAARDFAAWAHSTIGHEGASRLQPIVELDDAYDMSDYTGGILDDIEAAARREAKSLLAGEPLPARATLSQPDQVTANAGAESWLRSASRRARGHLSR